MKSSLLSISRHKIISFLWQHMLLLLSLNLMTIGVVLCVKSNLGSSVISSLPFVLSLAGENGMAPALTIGDYTIIMNFVLVLCQIAVLRRRFEPVQLFQLVIGFFFGMLIDLNMMVFSGLGCETVTAQAATQLIGCSVMGAGIALEVKCGSVTMPGEGISIAISRVVNRPFAKVKIYVDTLLVVLAVCSSYLFFAEWQWNVIGIGTLFAMIYVGFVVKLISPHLAWFERLLNYVPGFRRHIYGLLRFIRNRH